MEKYCLNCGKLLTKGQTKYCSNSCQKDYEYKQRVQKWKNNQLNGVTGTGISSFVRRYMLEKTNYSCQLCGWNKINPFSGKSPLEIHHIDGNYTNNKEENLQVLCPNCHSLTNNYKGMNQDSVRDRTNYLGRKKIENFCIDCGKEIAIGSIRCRECQAKNRTVALKDMPITREELKQLIKTTSFVDIGKKFNISDNGIRKWCDKFNLPRKKSEIKQYSEEEWQKI